MASGSDLFQQEFKVIDIEHDVSTSPALTTVTEYPIIDDCSAICPEYDRQTAVFYLVFIVGSVLSIISILENLLILTSLMADRKRRFSTYYLFLILWAAFDILTSLAYIPVIAIDQAKFKYESSTLNEIWKTYILEALTMSNIAMTASSYLIVFMQFERYLITVRSTRLLPIVKKYRLIFCAFSFAVGFAMKAPIYLEIEIVTRDCGYREYLVSNSPLGANEYYRYYNYWLRSLLCVYVPFLCMSCFNFKILTKLRKVERRAKLFAMPVSDHKLQVRAASRTFALVVFTYLIGNLLNVVINTWEFLVDNIMATDYCFLYLVSTDVVSLMTMLSCTLRLPIYLYCLPEIRRSITTFLTKNGIISCFCRFKIVEYIFGLKDTPATSSSDLVDSAESDTDQEKEPVEKDERPSSSMPPSMVINGLVEQLSVMLATKSDKSVKSLVVRTNSLRGSTVRTRRVSENEISKLSKKKVGGKKRVEQKDKLDKYSATRTTMDTIPACYSDPTLVLLESEEIFV